MRSLPLALALALAAGCSDPGPSPSDAGPDGSHGCGSSSASPTFDGQDPEIVVTVLGDGTTATEVKDGDSVPLIFPPQGGRVIFAGARVKNLDPCGATVTGVLRDEQTKQVRLDGRTVNLVASPDGWLETDPTDISSFSNIPVCPNQWSQTNLYDTEYELEVTIADRNGRSATKKVKVIPRCATPRDEAECLCICKGGYMLGEMCMDPGDAGPGDGGAEAGVDDGGLDAGTGDAGGDGG